METLAAPSRALVVTPHPDDAEGGCGGTIARWIQEGTRVAYVVCTDGRNGTGDVEMQPDRLASIREEEQNQAARVLGVHDVVFLRHPDGELEDDRIFRGELVHAIRRFTPDVVLTTEPHRFSSHQHRDHRMAGQVTLDACFPFARDPHHFGEHIREGLQPHKVGTVLFWGSTEPQVFVDITETIDLKVQSLIQHESQVGGRSTGHWIRQRAQEVGRMAGALYAEGFRRIEFRR
ncbi:MAG: PIG-L family deacetylase [Chloroflexota bacterium]|nr:PIG-L family deacetylase [Chloroflexota bacterium]